MDFYMGPALIAFFVLLIIAIGTTLAVVFRNITRRREAAANPAETTKKAA